MKPSEIKVKISMARREMQWWEGVLAKKSCIDCIHFHGGGCRLANGQTPPPDIQKTGCPEWTWDEVPF